MAITPISNLVNDALANKYSLGYFESWNLESLQGVLDAAEQCQAPIIVGFNGEFLTHRGRCFSESISMWSAVGRAAAEVASIPCGFIFNECANDEAVRQAADSGFNMVMLADPEASYETYKNRVASLVEYAHPRGVAVEAELGELPNGLPGEEDKHPSHTTDPETAARFVQATGVDLLSVSVGNVHVMVSGKRPLDFDLLERLHRTIRIPLGLHGGTGIPQSDLHKMSAYGVAKVNFGTYLKQRYLEAIRKALGNDEINPHLLLGMGGVEDVMVAGRAAVRDAVLDLMEALGCCGRA